MKLYTVEYIEDGIFSEVKRVMIIAQNKGEAYAKFLQMYPTVYAGWIANWIDNNKAIHPFNTFAGKPV